ncbi:MAG: hypothetical protein RL098_1058, partial [Bacteroidota bacterium]
FLETQKVNFSKSCLKPNLQTSRSENGGIVIQKTAAKGIIANSVAIADIKAAKRKTKTAQLKLDQGPNLPSKEMIIIAHKALGAKINFITKPSPKYDNGDLTIVDGQLGARPWKGNEWLGFDSDSVAFDIVFDKPKNCASIPCTTPTAGFGPRKHITFPFLKQASEMALRTVIQAKKRL